MRFAQIHRLKLCVDGFGFAGPILEGPQVMKLCEGRAAAGVPFRSSAIWQAVRILTGAILLDGVDTVVLEEDCTIESDRIAFNGPLKQWSNTREAGEDVIAGASIFKAGRRDIYRFIVVGIRGGRSSRCILDCGLEFYRQVMNYGCLGSQRSTGRSTVIV